MTNEEYKKVIKVLATNDENLDNLNSKQLECVYHLLADSRRARTSYRHCAPELEGKKINFNGYTGAGWFVEDHF